MNKEYKYVEKSLTPNMARELIQELFAEQTVQKQEIVRIVDEGTSRAWRASTTG